MVLEDIPTLRIISQEPLPRVKVTESFENAELRE